MSGNYAVGFFQKARVGMLFFDHIGVKKVCLVRNAIFDSLKNDEKTLVFIKPQICEGKANDVHGAWWVSSFEVLFLLCRVSRLISDPSYGWHFTNSHSVVLDPIFTSLFSVRGHAVVTQLINGIEKNNSTGEKD